jgi:acetoacetate decarboxylase/predicted SnoaL-like aldol condensation-catalyzing enzyme
MTVEAGFLQTAEQPLTRGKNMKTVNALRLLALTIGLGVLLSTQAIAANSEFKPHAEVPGPERLKMEAADYSGTVHKDVEYIADRQAIVNHVLAYSYLIDEGRWDEWFALFSDDIIFESTTPDLGTIHIEGKKAFKAFVADRYFRKPGQKLHTVRRHTQGNIHVAKQTATTAEARTYMLISKVPQADYLKTLTTGTYNVSLEKRNGHWTITRWYIECDARLAPSKIPEGFEKEITWTPDPLMVIPGATSTPLKGKLSLKNHPFSIPASSPIINNELLWWKDCDFIILDYVTLAAKAAEMLPEGSTTFPIPDMDGFSAVKLIWAKYRDSVVGPYNELIVAIPCLYEGQMYLYVPLIYVTTDTALIGGRELGGWPKKIGEINIERVGKNFNLTFKRGKAELSATASIGYKLFETPLPANAPVYLGYPHNLTLPLPLPTGKEQPTVPLPTLTTKLFPGVGSANPKPVVAQLIGAPWQISGTFYGASNTSIGMHASKDDPFDSLPILRVIGGTYIAGDMTLSIPDMKVLADWLK